MTPSQTPTQTASPTTSAELIFANEFESGNLSAWTSNTNDGGDLSATSSAALIGSYGLRALIDDNNTIYVTDDSPNAETRYRARFYFNPNSIPMASKDDFYLLYGNSGTSTNVLRIEFRRYSGAYQLRTSLRNDSSSWTVSSWFTISDALHFVEIDWRASTASGANNGSLTFWIDGLQRVVLSGVDNDTRRIDRIQVGAVAGINSGTLRNARSSARSPPATRERPCLRCSRQPARATPSSAARPRPLSANSPTSAGANG